MTAHLGRGKNGPVSPLYGRWQVLEWSSRSDDRYRARANFRFWPSRARQLSELRALNRPVRTCPLNDCSRAMKLAEEAPAGGPFQTVVPDSTAHHLHGRI